MRSRSVAGLLTMDMRVLVHVEPLLERYRVPATVFVVSNQLGREYWWDELVRALGSWSRARDCTLENDSQNGAGELFEWDQRRDRRTEGVPELIWSLYRRLRTLSPAQRRQALDQLWLRRAGSRTDPAVSCFDIRRTGSTGGGRTGWMLECTR